MKINADGKETSELLNSIFYDKPQYQILEDGQKGKIISGNEGFLLYGAFGTGKTIDILIALKFVAQYQTAEKGLRKIKVGVVRESNDSFVENFVSKIEMFDQEMSSRKGVGGYIVYDAAKRAKCKWRFRSTYPDGNGEFKEDGTVTEIEFHCFSVANEGDIKKWKGAEVTIVVFNEMNNYSENCFDVLSGRKNRYPFDQIDYQFWIGDLNPKLESDWESRRFIKKKVPGVKVIHYEPPLAWEANPLGDAVYMGKKGFFVENPQFRSNRSDGYAYWHGMTSGTDQNVTNNVLGLYYRGSTGTAVHRAFSGDEHIALVEPPSIHEPIIFGIDPGYANGFIAGYFIEEDVHVQMYQRVAYDNVIPMMKTYRKKRFKVMDSFFGAGGFEKTWRQRIMHLMTLPEYKMHYNMNRILFVSDPRTAKKRAINDGSRSIDLVLNDGFNCTVPKDEGGRVIDDIGFRTNTVDKYLKEQRLIIDPRNEPLITAFIAGYVTKGSTSEPDKKKSGGFSDVIDPLQYVLTFDELGGKVQDHIGPLNFSREPEQKAVNLYNHR